MDIQKINKLHNIMVEFDVFEMLTNKLKETNDYWAFSEKELRDFLSDWKIGGRVEVVVSYGMSYIAFTPVRFDILSSRFLSDSWESLAVGYLTFIFDKYPDLKDDVLSSDALPYCKDKSEKYPIHVPLLDIYIRDIYSTHHTIGMIHDVNSVLNIDDDDVDIYVTHNNITLTKSELSATHKC